MFKLLSTKEMTNSFLENKVGIFGLCFQFFNFISYLQTKHMETGGTVKHGKITSPEEGGNSKHQHILKSHSDMLCYIYSLMFESENCAIVYK